MNPKHYLILGGYGGVGRCLARHILATMPARLTIAGRSLERAEAFAEELKKAYPDRSIHAASADASDLAGLQKAFRGVDMVIVAATTPDSIATIAEAALQAGADMMDILVRGDVVEQLQPFQERLIASGRVFITQAGFHPGLPAPFIRYASDRFDSYETANILMTMNAIFERPSSTYEIIHEVGQGEARILKNGNWQKAGYRDAITTEFAPPFGRRVCFPLQMQEIYSLKDELGLQEMGVYSSGFNWFVDNLVFPLVMGLSAIKKGMGLHLAGFLMHKGILFFSENRPGVEFRLEATGLRHGLPTRYRITARYPDAFEFTSLAVIACLRQYASRTTNVPGLFLMGNFVQPKRIIGDLRLLGVEIEEGYRDDPVASISGRAPVRNSASLERGRHARA